MSVRSVMYGMMWARLMMEQHESLYFTVRILYFALAIQPNITLQHFMNN